MELLPFAIDRKLHKRLPVFLVPLVLPVVFVVLGFAASKFLPFGTMGEKAYTQVGNEELMQLLSVTGTHGITFVIFWFAATMASLWEAGFVWKRCRSQVLPLSLFMMVIFVSGGFRNIFDENESPTVRIAGVIPDQSALQIKLQADGLERGIAGLGRGGDPQEKVNASIDAYHQELFLRTRMQAAAGAAIVAWSESSGLVLKSREAEFLSQAQRLAREQSIYLVASHQVIADDEPPEKIIINENKLTVIDPSGEMLGQYNAARTSWTPTLKGSDVPLQLDTEFGKIAFAIGFDLDFPEFIRGAQDIDIIIAPAYDWKTLSPHHSLMATYRGLENGASLFRPTNNGVSIATDSHGRTLARTDHFRTTPHTIVAEVPTRGVKTFYATMGDWFAWLNVALFCMLCIAAYMTVRHQKGQVGNTRDNYGPDERRDRSRITAIQWRDSERDNNLHRNE